MHIKLKTRDVSTWRSWHQEGGGEVGAESANGEEQKEVGTEGREENSQTTQGGNNRTGAYRSPGCREED